MAQCTRLTCLSLLILTTACARTPDVEVSYPLPRSDVQVKVTEAVTCNTDNQLITVLSAEPTVKFSASDQMKSLRISSLDAPFSDSGLTFEYYDDGRLKSINRTSTGEGEAVIKAAVTLLSTFAGRAPEAVAPKYPAACKEIKRLGKGDPISIVFQSALPIDAFADVIAAKQPLTPMYWPVAADLAASPVYTNSVVRDVVGGICAIIAPPVPEPLPATWLSKARGDVELSLRQPADVAIELHQSPIGQCTAQRAPATPAFWQAKAQVPQLGQPYTLLIPQPAAFGSQVFGLSLSEAGTITKLQYDKNTGAAQVLNAANDVASEAIRTDTEETAEINAEIAKRAAQAKLAKCLANSDNCS